MLLLGLTGSIATGKSTVSSILSSPPYNLPIIDADVLARKVVEPGTAGYEAIVKYFSPTTPDLLLDSPSTGSDSKGKPLNRPALGRRVLATAKSGSGPRRSQWDCAPCCEDGDVQSSAPCYLRGCWAVVLDVPLLFESGLDVLCGTVMVVAVTDPKIQMKRLRERDPHLTAEDAENRVRSQGDVREKARRCEARGKGKGVVVLNDGDKEQLRAELGRVMATVKRDSPRWWGWLLLLCPPLAGLAGLWNFLRNRRINGEWQRGELQAKAKL